jgi:hypothetical protein
MCDVTSKVTNTTHTDLHGLDLRLAPLAALHSERHHHPRLCPFPPPVLSLGVVTHLGELGAGQGTLSRKTQWDGTG